ncbi:RNA polymerase factor sigma-54 [Virgibacillus sp. CBA3643]|uniref:RNA polymerase factor sigma-54 n=1 Tax=Virgibacillus sp. CBA3643 TaxID=2942278 RepID=UPI0035A355C1
MELALQQRQTLNLVMTTNLRQAIELLQYSTYDLYQFIQQQEMENPLIELVDKEDKSAYKGETTRIKRSENSSQDPFDFIASKEGYMRENLIQQARWLDIKEYESSIIDYLILNLDDNGYLPLSEREIALDLSIEVDKVSKGIELLQQLEPIGVGARSLKECLLLQLKYYYPEEQITASIIMDHLDMLANKKWHIIAKELGIPLSEVKAAYDFIRSLDPKPCTIISNVNTDYLNPDIIVDDADGKFVIHLNDGYLPEIRFNSQYSDLLHSNGDILKYTQDKYRGYQWLLSSIEQRRSTILKITHAVINMQRDFFVSGYSYLKPLTLKEIADEIEMHESTVSRATMNKVIQTPKGSFDFRALFTSKLNTEDGNSMSQTKVKILLEDFVEKENKYKPYSDQKISEFFKTKKGITISRRTVAKYREELKIPSSSKRKEIEV